MTVINRDGNFCFCKIEKNLFVSEARYPLLLRIFSTQSGLSDALRAFGVHIGSEKNYKYWKMKIAKKLCLILVVLVALYAIPMFNINVLGVISPARSGETEITTTAYDYLTLEESFIKLNLGYEQTEAGLALFGGYTYTTGCCDNYISVYVYNSYGTLTHSYRVLNL